METSERKEKLLELNIITVRYQEGGEDEKSTETLGDVKSERGNFL